MKEIILEEVKILSENKTSQQINDEFLSKNPSIKGKLIGNLILYLKIKENIIKKDWKIGLL